MPNANSSAISMPRGLILLLFGSVGAISLAGGAATAVHAPVQLPAVAPATSR